MISGEAVHCEFAGRLKNAASKVRKRYLAAPSMAISLAETGVEFDAYESLGVVRMDD